MLTEREKTIIDYIQTKVIDGYMLDDLKKIVKLPVISNQTGNCNFPIVIYIFSCIEFLGTLVSESPIPDGPGATQNRIWSYIELTFEQDFQQFQQHRSRFVQIFRHGLIHEFFAKNAGVSRNNPNLFWQSPGGKPVLDADRFYEIFKKSCAKLKSLINESEELAKRICERYTDLQEHNIQRWSSTSPTFTPVSTATLPREFPQDSCLATPSFESKNES